MVSLGLNETLAICKVAAGIAGNIFAFGLFVSPIPTFRRIISNQWTEQFSGLPYVYALLNCLVCAWYGTPLISSGNILVMTVNSIGAVFQIIYIILFITYAEKAKKLRMFGLLLAVFGLFAIIVAGSLQIIDTDTRRMVIGFLSGASLISMFASPLFIINLVIRTRSVEFMPFSLSLSTFLMSISFSVYGIFNSDPFVYVPNGIGTILGIVQLALFCCYKNTSREDSGSRTLVSCLGLPVALCFVQFFCCYILRLLSFFSGELRSWPGVSTQDYVLSHFPKCHNLFGCWNSCPYKLFFVPSVFINGIAWTIFVVLLGHNLPYKRKNGSREICFSNALLYNCRKQLIYSLLLTLNLFSYIQLSSTKSCTNYLGSSSA